jgi:hypothetical protein
MVLHNARALVLELVVIAVLAPVVVIVVVAGEGRRGGEQGNAGEDGVAKVLGFHVGSFFVFASPTLTRRTGFGPSEKVQRL